jgi:hypothetical protein
MVDQKDSLMREVDEELRREQLLRLWDQYGTYAVALAFLVIAGVGGYKYYEHQRLVAAEAAGARFATAVKELTQNKAVEARGALEDIVKTAPAGYATLARLRLAATLRVAGKTDDAAAAYEAIGAESGVDPLLGSFARLQAAMLRLDTASWTDMQNRLNDLAAESNPWRYSARELLGLAAYKAGSVDDARAEFSRLLSDRNVPPGIAERARVMMAELTQAELAKTPTPAVVKSDAPAATNAVVPTESGANASPNTGAKVKKP